MALNYLPLGLLLRILIRLPVKSLLRFRSVCRLWRSLISSSDFISLHSHNNTTSSTSILIKQYHSKTGTYAFYKDDYDYNNGSFAEIPEFDLPFECRGSHFIVMGCIHGLVALWDGVDGGANTVLLWNPSVKKCLTLPGLESEPHLDFFDFDGWDLWFGFGYDGSTDDYKVVRVLFFFEGSPQPVAFRVDVFSFNSRFWRSVVASPPLRVLGFGEVRAYKPVHLNGVVHWLTAEPFVVTFDFEKEVFGEIKWPVDLAPREEWCNEITVLHGSLSLIHRINVDRVDIWVMNEYGVAESWTKVFVVNLDVNSTNVCRNLAGFTRSGTLIVAGNVGRIVPFDVEKPRVVILEGGAWSWNVETYIESLLLVEGGEDLPLLHTRDSEN